MYLLVGYLNFVGGVILVGGVFLRRLVEVIVGIRSYNYFIRIVKLLKEVWVCGDYL